MKASFIITAFAATAFAAPQLGLVNVSALNGLLNSLPTNVDGTSAVPASAYTSIANAQAQINAALGQITSVFGTSGLGGVGSILPLKKREPALFDFSTLTNLLNNLPKNADGSAVVSAATAAQIASAQQQLLAAQGQINAVLGITKREPALFDFSNLTNLLNNLPKNADGTPVVSAATAAQIASAQQQLLAAQGQINAILGISL